MKFEESQIQFSIIQYLQLQKIYAVHIPNERKATPQAIMRLISLGMKPGFADLELWIPKNGVDKALLYHCMAHGEKYTGPMPTDGTKVLANVVYVEVKKPKGKQSENQIKFQKRCDVVGFDYHVVYSVEDVERLIRGYGNEL